MRRVPLIAALVAAALLLGAGSATAAEPAAGQLLPDEHVGDYPASRYEIWYDEGGLFSVGAKVLGLATELAFGATRALVSLATWLVTWAYSFGFANTLAEPAARIAEAYATRLIGPLELRYLALFIAVTYAAWNLLRHRIARGLGELAVSALVLIVGGAMLVQPAQMLRTGVGLTAGISAALLELTTDGDARAGTDPAAGEFVIATSAADPLTQGLRQAFVAQPHDLLNWGESLTGRCADARDAALDGGPHGTDDTPRELMRNAGCETQAAFNERASAERLMSALLVLVAAFIVLAALVLIAVTVVAAQLFAVGLVALLPFAVLLGVLPGGGRQLLWRWLAAGLRTLAVTVAMAGLLAFVLVTSDALLADATSSLLERFALLVVLAVVLFIARRKVLRGTQTVAGNLGRRLETARIGGTHGSGWMAPAALGGASGFGLAQLGRDGQQDLHDLRRNRLVAQLHHRHALHRATRSAAAVDRGGGADPGSGPGPDARSRSRLGAAGHRVARLTGAGVKAAASVTVDLPRTAPRAVARTQLAAGEATARARQRLQAASAGAHAAGRQWTQGLAHPLDAVRQERTRLIDEQARARRQAAARTQLRAKIAAGPEEQ